MPILPKLDFRSKISAFSFHTLISHTQIYSNISYSDIWLGHIAQSEARLTEEPEVPGTIPGLARYFRFSFR